MHVLDLLIVAVVILQAIWWARAGFMHSLFSLGGFWFGFVTGALLSPFTLTLTDDPFLKVLLVIVMVFMFASIGGLIGRLIGTKLSELTRRIRLGFIDTGLGAISGVIVTLLMVWLAAALLGGSPFKQLNLQLRESFIVQTMNEVLPPAPSVLSRIGGLINPHSFPQVFIGPEPRPVAPVEQPSTAEVASAIAAAGDSTVRIEGVGCGGVVTGSGFVVNTGLVMTNAHVVAGIENPMIIDLNGQRTGELIYFDPDLDIAILRTSGLAGSSLSISPDIQDRGTAAVALGYPGGGRLSGEPAGVLRSISARGLNIYGRRAVTRSMYELQTEVISGNSGGPIVLPDGTVIGLVVARSESDSSIGYALTSPQLITAIDEARTTPQPVSAQSCVPR